MESNYYSRSPIRGTVTEKCLECGKIWKFDSRDIRSPSIVDGCLIEKNLFSLDHCPQCYSVETETLEWKED